jgi:hypothetical protein
VIAFGGTRAHYQPQSLRRSKGAEVIILSAELMRDRITSLESANEAATKRRSRKKKRIQKQGTLTKGEGEDILAQKEAGQQIEREKR